MGILEEAEKVINELQDELFNITLFTITFLAKSAMTLKAYLEFEELTSIEVVEIEYCIKQLNLQISNLIFAREDMNTLRETLKKSLKLINENERIYTVFSMDEIDIIKDVFNITSIYDFMEE